MSRALPDSLRPVVAYLLPFLGSADDREALAAARTLGRKLNAAGCDFRSVAAVIEPPAPPWPARPEPPKAKSARALSWTAPVYVELDDAQRAVLQEQLAEIIENRDGKLKYWDVKDAATTLRRLDAAQPLTAKMLERAAVAIARIRRPA